MKQDTKRYPKGYYASQSDLIKRKWRRFNPKGSKYVNGYKIKAGILATIK